MKFTFKRLALGVVGSALLCSGAYAATQSVTANLTFDTALSFSSLTNINFGTLKAGIVGAVYTISTAGTVTPSSGGIVINSTGQAAGQFTITGSTTQTIAISTTGGYSAADKGVTLSAATCKYDTGTETACDSGLTAQAAPGAGKTLKVGVTATSDGTATAGQTASPTVTVTVVYG